MDGLWVNKDSLWEAWISEQMSECLRQFPTLGCDLDSLVEFPVVEHWGFSPHSQGEMKPRGTYASACFRFGHTIDPICVVRFFLQVASCTASRGSLLYIPSGGLFIRSFGRIVLLFSCSISNYNDPFSIYLVIDVNGWCQTFRSQTTQLHIVEFPIVTSLLIQLQSPRYHHCLRVSTISKLKCYNHT